LILAKKGKLELTWVGKDERVKLEPRVLAEDPAKSYGDSDSENMLIYGDNLLALKALEQDFAGKIQCIYIDPPFNTGAAFEHYDDGLEHSIWLTIFRDRLEELRKLLRSDGSIFIHLDSSEMAYAKVIMDEIFGRGNYLNTIAVKTLDPSGFKATGTKVFSTTNYLLLYAKERQNCKLKQIFSEKIYDKQYSQYITNRGEDYKNWQWLPIKQYVSINVLGFESPTEASRELGADVLEDEIAKFAIENAASVFQTAAIGGGALIKRKETIESSRNNRGKVFIHPGEDVEDFYILNGRQIIFYDKRIVEIDGRKVPGEIITDFWPDISWNGIAQEGGVQFKNGKKPEALIKRVLEMASDENDWVLDSFAGSGTTGAVAHKMGRKWIMCELGDHCHTHIIPRMKMIVSGSDQGGISKAVNWQGGGGFKYYRLAESLLVTDKDLSTRNHPVYIINPRYDEKMLIRAICKVENFRYRNDGRLHGISSESRFLHVTTNLLTQAYLDSLAEDIGQDQSLLIYCTRKRNKLIIPDNIEIKKIPRDLLSKCDFQEDK
jgi:adenine-specific DNA-methyltransferase